MDIIYLFIGLVLGLALGFNIKASRTIVKKSKPDVPKEIEELREELLVYKNLRESLLADVRYWRNKANSK
jgi:uncharacterized membrane-anchored protein YhcB (DUF1043 family)